MVIKWNFSSNHHWFEEREETKSTSSSSWNLWNFDVPHTHHLLAIGFHFKGKALFINDVILFWVFPDPHPPPSTNIIIWQTPCPIASSSSSKLSSFLIWKCNKYNSFFDFCSSHEHNIMGKATFHSKYLEIKCKIKEFHLQSFFEGPPALHCAVWGRRSITDQ